MRDEAYYPQELYILQKPNDQLPTSDAQQQDVEIEGASEIQDEPRLQVVPEISLYEVLSTVRLTSKTSQTCS